jgi:biotin transport system substrate-specific component
MSSPILRRPLLAGLAIAHGAPARGLRVALFVLAGVALLTLAAKVKVPFYPVPMTLQTLAVLVIGALYGARLGAATVVAYIAAGVLLGLPVFTNTPPVVPGPMYLLGPTGGFLVGFVIAAYVAGCAIEQGFERSLLALLAAGTLATAIVLALGTLWLGLFASVNGTSGIGLYNALILGAVPFLLGEALKIALFAALVFAAHRIAGRS